MYDFRPIRRPLKSFLISAPLAALTAVASATLASGPAEAQVICTPSPYVSGDLFCSNSGTVSGGAFGMFVKSLGTGNATATNSGSLSGIAAGMVTETPIAGNATATNSGTISAQNGMVTQADGTGNATATNSGNVNASVTNGVGIWTVAAHGNATATNSGTVSGSQYGMLTSATGGGTVTATNSGNVTAGAANSNSIGIFTVTSNGNATTINSGNVNDSAASSTGVVTSTTSGNATTTNSGIVSANGVNSIGISTIATTGNAATTNSGTVSAIGAGGVGVFMQASGLSTLINSGTISAPGGAAIQFQGGADRLTLLPGSFIVGAINLVGTNDTVNVNAVNQNLTFNTLAGATVTGTVPYVVVGNRIVSVDPTGFAVADRSLMTFTGAVSGLVGSRGGEVSANGGGGALGFAGADDIASRVDDAFAQVMGYASTGNDAIAFKNPTVTTADGTTVWAKGFYGQRTQEADGPSLRNVTNFYGGAIGADRLIYPGLRLGGFVGGGATSTAIDLNAGNAKSDIVFGGLYGRHDIGAAFIDFALLGGHTANHSTRDNINNNMLANGLETATASYGGWFLSPEIAAGYRYDMAPGWNLTPAARIRYLAASFSGFTETGSTADLTAGKRTLLNVEERADLTLMYTMLSEAGRVRIGLTTGVLGEQRTGSGNVNAILLGQALTFVTPDKSSITGAFAGASPDWRTLGGVSLFAAAEYTLMSDSSNTVIGKAGVRVGF
jgi:uncharacterized protein with beta-barrel porin domain